MSHWSVASVATVKLITGALLTVIGVDIGKEVFHIVGLASMGRLPCDRRSGEWVSKDAFEKLLPCIARMRVCLDSRPSPQGTQTTGTPRKRPSSGCVVSDELSSERTAYSGSQGPT